LIECIERKQERRSEEYSSKTSTRNSRQEGGLKNCIKKNRETREMTIAVLIIKRGIKTLSREIHLSDGLP